MYSVVVVDLAERERERERDSSKDAPFVPFVP